MMNARSPTGNPWLLKGLIILLLLLPVPVLAQGPVDLTLGATGAFPWSVSGIIPGSSGSTFIELHNNGTVDGVLYIWVDNISQTDASGNPGGGLANYMYFNVSHPRLTSTAPLPTGIYSFPTGPMLPNYIIINPLYVGETVRLNWTWEFIETGQPQNDAQNNSLRFNISYTLVNATPIPTPTTVPPTPAPPVPPGGGGSFGQKMSTWFTFGELPLTVYPTQIPTVYPTQGEVTPVMNLTPTPTPTIEKIVPVPPDHRVIMITAFIVLTIAYVIHSSRKKHPRGEPLAEIIWAIGIIVTIIGILYQAYIVSLSSGQHLKGLHAVVGLIATIIIVLGLIFWIRHEEQKEKKDGFYIWLLMLGVLTTFLSLLLGLIMAGII